MKASNFAPGDIKVDGRTITLREIASGDNEALLAFATRIPTHDLLFLMRDIRNPKVVDAWLQQVRDGQIWSLVAEEEGRIVGCVAMVRDELSWSSHVSDIRILVSEESRGLGVGRLFALHCLDRARDKGIAKLSVRMTPDQDGALRLFEEMGFRPEALLRDQVRDAEGGSHDIAVMALDVSRHASQHQAYGMD